MSPIFFGSSATVLRCGMPTTAVGPVADETTPTFICAWAATQASADSAANRTLLDMANPPSN